MMNDSLFLVNLFLFYQILGYINIFNTSIIMLFNFFHYNFRICLKKYVFETLYKKII